MQPYANMAQSTQLFECQKSYSLYFTFFSTTCQEKKKRHIQKQPAEGVFISRCKERKKTGCFESCFVSPLIFNIALLLLDFPGSSVGKESVCNVGDLGSISVLGRYPGEGKSYPFQYSSLENSMDCIAHGVTKSWTRLSNFYFFHFYY